MLFTVGLREPFRVGRDGSNDLVLRDEHASRHHACFGAGWVRDEGSRHGTLVNGARVVEKRLGDGDVVQIGGVLLTFRADEEPAASTVLSAPRLPQRAGADRRLELLYEVSRVIGTLDEPDQLIDAMLAAAIDVLGCERGFVGLVEGAQGAGRRFARARSGDAKAADDLIISRELLDAMCVRRQTVLVRGEQPLPSTLARQGVRSAMGAPLVAGERMLGCIYLDDRARAGHFTEEDLDFLTALAHLAAAALVRATEHHRRGLAVAALRDAARPAQILGESEPMRALLAQVGKYAGADAAVLIQGESGTGKELVARAIHELSPRADGPFVALNCAAIPETMIESELFGHMKGAFTGADRTVRGKLALAHQGTLLLDEVGDLGAAAQAKLLRAIEQHEVVPLGAERAQHVDVRVLAATHKDLEQEVAARRFRHDLYYRLVVGEVRVPPLRSRGDDVLLLANTFLRRAARRMGKPAQRFSDAATAALRRYSWPGNVRQLENEIERAVILGDGPVLELEDLRGRLDGRVAAAAAAPLAQRFAALEEGERALVAEALAAARGNLAEAARLLGITRIMMKKRVDRFGLRLED
jgi:Nif-specific regulatory protein